MNIEIQSEHQTKRSWLARIFPSVAKMETELEWMQREADRMLEETTVLRKRCDELLDRVVRLTTGYAMSEPMPNIVDTTEAIMKAQKDVHAVNLKEELEAESIKAMLEERRRQEAQELETVPVKPNGSHSGTN